jgi:Trk K+ transport system NAD-binding subunit
VQELTSGGAFFVVQVNRREGGPITRPAPETRLEAGDGLVLIGRRPGARALFEPRAARGGFRESAR